jgi:hypothetical protein
VRGWGSNGWVRWRGVVALALIALAAVTQLPDSGANAAAHYALVQSFFSGTPRIDHHLNQSGDIAWTDGHYYVAKSPGLAALSLPLYALFDLTGQVPRTDPVSGGPPGSRYVTDIAIWQVTLLVVGFFFALLLLVRSSAEQVVPGTGTAVAAALGLGTMLLPFADNYFSHVPSATLAFAAFVVLFRSQDSRSSRRVFAAGLLAGLAVFVEAPVLIVAAIIGCYALLQLPRLRRAAAFATGLIVGVLPLALYDLWAFGSPFATGYADAVKVMGTSGHDQIGANSQGFFGLTYPHFHALIELLFSARGLFVLTPVTLVAIAALPLLARRGGQPREAATIAALAIALLLYNAAYYLPFGGYTPGPRFLIPLLPFLGLPLAEAFRAWPRTTLATVALSCFWMISATVGQPLLATALEPTAWMSRIFHNEELTGSILTQGRLGIVVFVLPATFAVVLVCMDSTRIFWPSRQDDRRAQAT